MMRIQSRATAVVAALVMSVATIAAAQEPKPESKTPAPSPSPSASPRDRRGVRPGDVQKVFVLKHLGLNDTARLLKVFPAEIGGMDDGSRRVLSVSAAPAVVAAIEETLKRLDVTPPPIKNVEVTIHVLECAASGDAGSVPPDLQDVVVQLKRTFNYAGCALARTLFTRAADGSHIQAEFREHTAGTYELHAVVEMDSSESPVVRLRQLTIQNLEKGQGGRLSGDLDLRDGQKIVFGRLGSAESGKDQIVVLTARIVP